MAQTLMITAARQFVNFPPVQRKSNVVSDGVVKPGLENVSCQKPQSRTLLSGHREQDRRLKATGKRPRPLWAAGWSPIYGDAGWAFRGRCSKIGDLLICGNASLDDAIVLLPK